MIRLPSDVLPPGRGFRSAVSDEHETYAVVITSTVERIQTSKATCVHHSRWAHFYITVPHPSPFLAALGVEAYEYVASGCLN